MKKILISILILFSILDSDYYYKYDIDDIILNPLPTTIPILKIKQMNSSFYIQDY